MGTWGFVRANPFREAGAPAAFFAVPQATRARPISHVPALRRRSLLRFVFMIVFVEAANLRVGEDTIRRARFYSIQLQME
jgi:hypothetical protein